jgi:hypothetical protein
LLAATLYQGNHDRNHSLWNLGSTEIYISTFSPFCICKNPKYVDETGCKEHGKFRVEIQKHSPDIVHIEVTFQFGLTELIVSAKQKGAERESNITVKYS